MIEVVERQLKTSKRTAGTAPGIGKKRQLESSKSGVALPPAKCENAPQLLPPASKRWHEGERRGHARARLHQLHSAEARAQGGPLINQKYTYKRSVFSAPRLAATFFPNFNVL